AARPPGSGLGAGVDHALASRGLRNAAPEEAAWLSLVAYVRHMFTDYDALRDQDYDEDSARFFVAEEIETVLKGWGVRRRLAAKEGGLSSVRPPRSLPSRGQAQGPGRGGAR